MNAMYFQKNSGMNKVAIIIAVAVVALGAVAVITQRPKQSVQQPSPTPAIEREMKTVTPDGDADDGVQLETQDQTMTSELTNEVKVIAVEGGSFYYKPNEIRVKKGQKIRIEFSAADMMHDFNIDELNVSVPITKEGETSTVEFTATTVGTFEYYCSVGQHRAMGQIGKLIVE